MAHKIALVGFGTVGQGLVEILVQKQASLFQELHEEIQVVAVADLLKGSIYHPDGLDLNQLLKVVQETGKVDSYPDTPGLLRGWNSMQIIQESNADTVIEVTYTDVKTGQPGIDHCRAALNSGKNVITSNKGPIALAYEELSALAKQNGVQLSFEGTVMSGTPAIRLPQATLLGNEIKEIRGILNGTTNYMLARMEDGLSYEAALKEAQELGYAEADPTSDVEGYDALYKVLILAQVVMGVSLQSSDVERRGITDLSSAEIKQAQQENKRWKLIARIQKQEEKVLASVKPEMLPITDPLASVSGVTNAVTYECDLAGPITLMGAGAGRTPTGFSLLIDLIHIIKSQLR